MLNGEDYHFDFRDFISRHGGGAISKYRKGQNVYAQGDPGDALFFIVSGRVEITVISEYGKEAVIGIVPPDGFFGEGCLGHLLRTSAGVAASDCEIARFDVATITAALDNDPAFSKFFMTFLLERNEQLKANLVDHLFNSSEKRLARILLTLANTGLGSQSQFITVPINQETLAKMVGTTRSRINQFMNKFRILGFIEYNGKIKVHNSLLNVILHTQTEKESAQAKSVTPPA